MRRCDVAGPLSILGGGQVMAGLAAELGPATAPGGGTRILVVDDEDVVRMLVVDLLRERGYDVEEAVDAFVAMDLLQARSFDLMVTDIGLPGGFDGCSLARRARVFYPDLPILFITGYAFGANGDIVLEPGIPVLTKPFTLTALSTHVRELLARHEGSADH